MPKKPLSASELRQFEEGLKQMLRVVQGDLEVLAQETRQLPGNDVSAEDSGSEIVALEISFELLGQDERTAQQILDALGRIKEGTFGRCTACNDLVGKLRLRAMPHAAHCITCQRKHEAGEIE